MNYDINSDVGYVLDVDLEYPIEIIEKTKDLPLAVTRRNTNDLNKSDY